MGRWISRADVPTIDPDEADRLIADIEAEAIRRVPALTAVSASSAILATFRRIVTRWHVEGPAALATQTTGPFGLGFVPDRRVGWRLADDELADLRIYAGIGTAIPGPVGSFPDPGIDRAFWGLP